MSFVFRSFSRNRAKRKGFTLVELAVGVAVMSLGLGSSVLALQTGLRSLDLARNQTLAAQILQSELESLRLKSWSDISALPEKAEVDLSSTFSDSSLASRFSLVRVCEASSDHPSDMKDIVLTVTWTSSFGTTHSRSFQTSYCKNGLYDYYYTLAN